MVHSLFSQIGAVMSELCAGQPVSIALQGIERCVSLNILNLFSAKDFSSWNEVELTFISVAFVNAQLISIDASMMPPALRPWTTGSFISSRNWKSCQLHWYESMD
jgi:hypothetical protein